MKRQTVINQLRDQLRYGMDAGLNCVQLSHIAQAIQRLERIEKMSQNETVKRLKMGVAK